MRKIICQVVGCNEPAVEVYISGLSLRSFIGCKPHMRSAKASVRKNRELESISLIGKITAGELIVKVK